MLTKFIAFLGVQQGEERRMWMLLGMGFFMGIFQATYQVGTESLFIQEVGQSHLDIAFLVTGTLGIISTMLFVFLQRRMKFGLLSSINMLLIFIFTTLLRFSFELGISPVYAGIQVIP